MSQPILPILVTGAARGIQGSTGAHLVALLRGRGLPVRAMVHREDQRTERLRRLGAEVVVADFLDRASMDRALAGIGRGYFAYPVRAGLVDAAKIYAAAARQHRLSAVVAISHLNAGPEALSPRTVEHGIAETIFDEAGIGAIHLRAAVFFENLRRNCLHGIARDGEFRLPLGSGATRLPLIAANDVARIAAGLLTAPKSPEAARVFAIGEVQTADGIAGILSTVLGHAVRYHGITDEEWRAEAIAREGEDNPTQINHLSALWATMRMVGERDPDRFHTTQDVFSDVRWRPGAQLLGVRWLRPSVCIRCIVAIRANGLPCRLKLLSGLKHATFPHGRGFLPSSAAKLR